MLKQVKRLTPLTGKGWRGRGEKGARDKVKKNDREGGSGMGRRFLARDTWILVQGHRVPSYATADRAGLST